MENEEKINFLSLAYRIYEFPVLLLIKKPYVGLDMFKWQEVLAEKSKNSD